jgi:hypothetical protein
MAYHATRELTGAIGSIVICVAFAYSPNAIAFPNAHPTIKWPNSSATLNLNSSTFADPTAYALAIGSGFYSWQWLNIPGSSFAVTTTRDATDGAVGNDGISGVVMGGLISGAGAETYTWTLVRSPGDTIIVEKNMRSYTLAP